MAVTIKGVKNRAKQAAAVDAGKQPSTFEQAFQQNWNRVWEVLFRLVGDRDEAEDLALEVFWRLYRNPPAEDRNLPGWLYRVATRLGFNALRDRKRRQQYELQAGSMDLNSDSPENPSQLAEQAEARRQVRTVLQQMKPRTAQILILRHSGLSYAEIAAATGVSAGSVGSLLARAEKEFAERFQALER